MLFFAQSLRTALFYAAQNGHLEVVQALLSRPGVEIGIEDKVNLFMMLVQCVFCMFDKVHRL